MYTRNERIESLIGWTCNLTDNEINEQGQTYNECISEFRIAHEYMFSDLVFEDWMNFKNTIKFIHVYEINLDREILRTSIWQSEEEYIQAAAIVKQAYELWTEKHSLPLAYRVHFIE